MTVREIITELVRKECETYRLVGFGLLSSVEEGVERLLPLSGVADASVFDDLNRFRNWRNELLRSFYRQLDYTSFLEREGESVAFRHFLFHLNKRITFCLRERWKEPTIDKDLSVPPRTLAFKLSVMLGEELFRREQPAFSSVGMPSVLDEICRKACRECFPLELDGLLVRLKKEDSEFWNDIYLTVKRLTDCVTSGQSISIQYKKEIIQDTWGDASLLLHDKVVAGVIPVFETSLHFRNYIARICLNKCREAVRRNNLPEIFMSVTGEMNPGEFPDAGEERPDRDLWTGSLVDIDCDNEEEVGRCFTVVLWDKIEPWYTELTKGIEEKTELIFLHYVEGLSYEAIATMKGKGLTGDERNRLENKLRQDMVRTRRTLKQRFIEILKKSRKG